MRISVLYRIYGGPGNQLVLDLAPGAVMQEAIAAHHSYGAYVLSPEDVEILDARAAR